MKELDDDFLFGGIDADDESLKVFDKPEKNQDGIYRPKLEDAKDKKVGYKSVIRFLPNLIKDEDGKILQGQNAILKHIHYVDLKNEPTLVGFYDCEKNFEPKCDMCTMYWKLHNSKNQAEVEKAELINRQTKYYSYVLVIEDDQHPEWVGKLMIFPYPWTIKEKINSEKTGEVTGNKCNVFDFSYGKDFKLIIKEKGPIKQNYDASQFLEISPIKLYNEEKKAFVTAPVDGTGKIVNPKVHTKIKEFLFNRTLNLEDHLPVRWDEETREKVYKILTVMSGEDIFVAEEKANMSKKDSTVNMKVETPIKNSDVTTSDDFFDLDS